jgi:ABC-type branched-subunit amino acid transport system substrate-binding protein
MQKRRWRTVRVLLFGAPLVGLVAGCGARWSDAERAGVFARHEGPAAAEVATDDPAAVSATGPTVGPGAIAVLQPDDRTNVGPPTTGATAAGPTAVPCAAASKAIGVTADEIVVGNLATISGPVPGLGATAQAATRAYVAYQNAKGGVCGRKIRLVTADDGFESPRARNAMTDLAAHTFGLAGLFASGAGGAAEIVQREGYPIVGSVGSPELRVLPTVFNLNPPADPRATSGKYDFLKANGVATVALVTLASAPSILELNLHQAEMEAAGLKVVNRQELPVTTLSFDSAARAVANSKADYLFFLAAGQHDAAMARAMRDSGYTLKFQEYLTGYGSNYSELAGSAAEGTTSWIRSLPTEEKGSNPVLTAFVDWMTRIAPGQAADVFAADAWAASKAFFDTLEHLSGPITRDAFVAGLRTTHDYDADGFIGRIDLGNRKSNGCLIGMQFSSGSWHRLTPANGFLC